MLPAGALRVGEHPVEVAVIVAEELRDGLGAGSSVDHQDDISTPYRSLPSWARRVVIA
jgi:hypothetical protein